jgi:hypothetical protein
MADKFDFVVQVAAWRELANRAKRLAGGLVNESDRAPLLEYSQELEQKAARLEAEIQSEVPTDGAPSAGPTSEADSKTNDAYRTQPRSGQTD